MQPKNSIPTPLFDGEERAPVRIVAARRPRPLRGGQIAFSAVRVAFVWLLALLRRRASGRDHTSDVAVAVRVTLERLGGLWIKAGQLLAMRRDLFPEAFCTELSFLQDSAFGFPASHVRAIIEAESGAPLEHLYSRFDPVPIAAASIGQVHRARLRRNGVDVAVKVQRPYVELVMHRDLRFIRRCARLLERCSILPHARWLEMVWELDNIMRNETDYRVEASFIRRMRVVLKGHDVYAPKVFRRESSRRVLVMEFIRGVFMTEFIRAAETDPPRLRAWMAENRIKAGLVGRRLYETHTRQVFEDNLFHCDLHPGNIVLLRDSRLALIDFGSIGSIDRSKLKKYYVIFQAMGQGDYTKAAEVFLLLGPPLRPVRVQDVKADIVRTLRQWEVRVAVERLSYHERSLTYAMQGIANVYRQHRIGLGWEFMQVNRAEVTMDASLAYLLPRINYHEMIRRYERAARRRELHRAASGPAMLDRVVGLVSILDVAANLAENTFYESERLRNQLTTFDSNVTVAGLVLSTGVVLLSRLSLAAAVVVLLSFVQDVYPNRATGVVDAIMAATFGRMQGTWRLLLLVGLVMAFVAFRRLSQKITALSTYPAR
ncbi:MAG TPA: AarF/ABC1/UbiB kinase family protein [Vicinamibacterales bacterium]|nr:AarF/ABC1/UbiB kinase family protein [Vicinamibacterales bacterium]